MTPHQLFRTSTIFTRSYTPAALTFQAAELPVPARSMQPGSSEPPTEALTLLAQLPHLLLCISMALCTLAPSLHPACSRPGGRPGPPPTAPPPIQRSRVPL